MVGEAFAQSAPGAGSIPATFVTLVPFILIFFVFYFLVIRPQQKKVKDHQEMLKKIKKNDEVITTGGIYGKVMALSDDVVTLEVSPNVRLRVHKNHISDVVKAEKTVAKEAK